MKKFIFKWPRLALVATLAVSALVAACSGSPSGPNGLAGLPGGATPVANVATLTLDSGPNKSSFNAPFVSVTVCLPGTATCQTIDHLLVDTGSSGLRILNGVLNSSMAALPAVKTATGAPVGECAQFVSGYTWGSVRSADVKLAGEVASNIPVEIIGDTAASYASVPADCSSSGANMGTVAAMGANGIIGVGLWNQDCGAACASRVIPGTYYGCTGSTCVGTVLPLASQVANPVASFPKDNNGVLVTLPAVAAGGTTGLTGSLIFGIGTQDNNALGTATVYKTDNYGNFVTTYKSKKLASSFLDTGSNGLYFPDATIPSCTRSTGFFCPPTPLALTATNASPDGTATSKVDFTLEAIDNLDNTKVGATIGGGLPAGLATSFDWGLPFFFGRSVFVAIEGKANPKGTGPLWAY